MEGLPDSPAVKLRDWLESMADPNKEPWSDSEDDDWDGNRCELSMNQDRSGVIVIDPTVGFQSSTDLADESNATRKVDDRRDDDGHADGEGTEDYSDDARSCDSGFTSSMDGAGK